MKLIQNKGVKRSCFYMRRGTNQKLEELRKAIAARVNEPFSRSATIAFAVSLVHTTVLNTENRSEASREGAEEASAVNGVNNS